MLFRVSICASVVQRDLQFRYKSWKFIVLPYGSLVNLKNNTSQPSYFATHYIDHVQISCELAVVIACKSLEYDLDLVISAA